MPLYDYDCAACGRRIEVVHGVYAAGPEHCPNCGGGPLKKAIAAPAVHFKGSGWAKKERRAAAKSSTSEGGRGGGDDSKEPAKIGTGGNGAGDKGGDGGDKGGDGGSKKSASSTAPTSD